jgi:hypothetical protein
VTLANLREGEAGITKRFSRFVAKVELAAVQQPLCEKYEQEGYLMGMTRDPNPSVVKQMSSNEDRSVGVCNPNSRRG